MSPRVTVVMPVHNEQEHIAASIASVVAQTYPDWELLVVDDGSTDASAAVLAGIEDPRLRIVSQANGGIVSALNAGLASAEGEFIARLDADDVMAPDRLARQVAFLEHRRDIVACGTHYRMFGDRTGLARMPRTPGACRARLLFGTCIAHGTAMLRASVVRRGHLRYRSGYDCAEDYKLFSELSQHGPMANLDYVGLEYRVHARQTGTARADVQRSASLRISSENLCRHGVDERRARAAAEHVAIEGTGPRAALRYVRRNVPVLLATGYRAAGAAGVHTAARLAREQLNSALRTHSGGTDGTS